jgi:putative glutathione S-transferase
MGVLVDGVWRSEMRDMAATDGSFVRSPSQFHDRIEQGGRFSPEAGRYRLYVSWACPWAHRTLIYRTLKGLEQAVDVTYVDPLMLENGWEIAEGADPLNDARRLWQIYVKAAPRYSGRVSVPVLWDSVHTTIVNNESSEIVRMLDSWPGARGPLLRPPDLTAEIDLLNEQIYSAINNGVYRAGFATSQAAYEEAFNRLFEMLDRLESRLAGQEFLLGNRPIETDWRLFTTLVRFDAVYYGHFKCNRNRLVDFPSLWDYTRTLYQMAGIRDTIRFDQIKLHYYGSHRTINPTGIVPAGPRLDFEAPTLRNIG